MIKKDIQSRVKAAVKKAYEPLKGEEETVLLKVKRAGFDQGTGKELETPVLIRITSRLFKGWLKSHKNLGFLISDVVFVPDSAKKVVKEIIEKGKKEFARIEGMKPSGADERAMKEERLDGIKTGMDYLNDTFLK
jgi:hypothetical protein